MVRGYDLRPWPNTSLNVTTPGEDHDRVIDTLLSGRYKSAPIGPLLWPLV
jgi:hypothetical protein